MKWLELCITVAAEDVEAVASLFHRFGHGGVAIEEEVGFTIESQEDPHPSGKPVKVKTYLPVDNAAPVKQRDIEDGFRFLSLIHPFEPLQTRIVEEEDWAESWKAHFGLHRIGQRIVIKPTWQRYIADADDILVELDPGMAFGTGLHPTTRMCLLELERRLRPGMKVLDLGTGSGILAIASAKLGSPSVLALDVDSTAVEVARANVAANDVAGVITVERGSLAGALKQDGGLDPSIPVTALQPFDLILANIVAKVIHELAEALLGSLKPGGVLIASGIIAEHLDALVSRLTFLGATIIDVVADDDWRTIVATVGPG